MKTLGTTALGLIIAAWGMSHFMAKYIQWVLSLKNYEFLLGIQAGSDPVQSLLGLQNILSFAYIIFWVGFGLIIALVFQRALDRALKIRKRKQGDSFWKNKEKIKKAKL